MGSSKESVVTDQHLYCCKGSIGKGSERWFGLHVLHDVEMPP